VHDACPACGGTLEEWRSVPGGEPSDHSRYELMRCASCGSAVTVGQAPPPDAYESGQYSIAPPRAAGAVDLLQRAFARQPVRFLRRAGLPRGARVLDVGAGPGRLVAALREAGYDATGIEPSARSAALAEVAGARVLRRGVAEHDDADLDAVVLWHVLEHLEDPAGALATVRGWLRPGGLALVATPNAASLQAAIGGDGWMHWDAPRHRAHFTADGLERLLGRTGFEPQRTHHWVIEQNLHGMWMAMLVRLGMRPSFPFHLLKRNIDVTARDMAITGLGAPLAVPAVAVEAAAALLRRGGTVAVLARKI
jgi:2-polyprenyl-3-methyl-5-hydroxy-6-metoxy-1,4-benzoquinol methylase